ncbi:CD3337/EF1877 family mobilome membrane protein [Sporolactobacillus pectinivorans]|uniref:CD3337/EF1877 family mobilome membrane protein n=1 Tax=Sporolactobacillus pectinivorans TaxID=1591408 RepID=UPI000C25D276
MRLKKSWRIFKITYLVTAGSLLFFTLLGTVAHASGLVDDTVNAQHAYSQYPLGNYQLDFYVDNSWDWLPWNWTDGIGKQVMYGLYAITNFIWTLSLYLSNATGYLVQEAYSLDFVSKTANAIGKNMQTLAGISPSGFQSSGFYPGFLLIFILILGIYVTYVGLIKRETTKVIHAVMNFLVVFLLSASFIAYAPDYISKINSFSADVSKASLSLGTKMIMPHSASQGQDSAVLIRNNLFSIQVQQPWLLLQYGNSDIAKIGPKRVEKLLSTDPDANNGQDRETVVKEEIEKDGNKNLTLTKTTPRLGMVFFLFLFNIGISIFVFLLSGIMIFSQILFIIYALFLPISFLLSMIPGFNGMGKQAIMKLFNVIMTRAGITLIVTIAFSISTMLYALSSTFPFFLIAFLQIVTFAGIYAKLGDLMGLFHLQANDSQQMGRRVLQKPYLFLSRETRKLRRKMGRVFTAGTGGTAKGTGVGAGTARQSRPSQSTQANHKRPSSEPGTLSLFRDKKNFEVRAGQGAGVGRDTKKRSANKPNQRNEQVTDLPIDARYVLVQGKKQISDRATKIGDGLGNSTTQKLASNNQKHEENRIQHRPTLAQRRMELDRARQQSTTEQTFAELPKSKQPKIEPSKKQKMTVAGPIRTRSLAPSSTPTMDNGPVNPPHSSNARATTSHMETPALNRPIVRMPNSTVHQDLENPAFNTKRLAAKRKKLERVFPKSTVRPVTLKNTPHQSQIARRQKLTEKSQQTRQSIVRRRKGRQK